MNELVTVAVGTNEETDLMKALLESEGIFVVLTGEFTNSIAAHQVAAGGTGAVRLLVPMDQEARARELLQDQV